MCVCVCVCVLFCFFLTYFFYVVSFLRFVNVLLRRPVKEVLRPNFMMETQQTRKCNTQKKKVLILYLSICALLSSAIA